MQEICTGYLLTNINNFIFIVISTGLKYPHHLFSHLMHSFVDLSEMQQTVMCVHTKCKVFTQCDCIPCLCHNWVKTQLNPCSCELKYFIFGKESIKHAVVKTSELEYSTDCGSISVRNGIRPSYISSISFYWGWSN